MGHATLVDGVIIDYGNVDLMSNHDLGSLLEDRLPGTYVLLFSLIAKHGCQRLAANRLTG